jgi:hypothetical protein
MVDTYASTDEHYFYANTYGMTPQSFVAQSIVKNNSPPPAYETVFPQNDGTSVVYPQIVYPQIYNSYH